MDEPQVDLTAGEAALQLGVAVTTLRSWHRRYGLGPGSYAPGRHRRYTPADMRRLTLMRRLTAEGWPAGQAARTALSADLDQPPSEPLTFPSHPQQVRGLVRAAVRLDTAVMGTLLDKAIAGNGVVAAWERLIRPAFHIIEARQAAGQQLVDAEHVLSQAVSAALAGRPRIEPTTVAALLACADEEQHTLPLEALAAALAEMAIGCRHLGARVPTPALQAAIKRIGPKVLVLWSHGGGTARTEQLDAALRIRPGPLLVMAAGPGWTGRELPSSVYQPDSLGDALRRILTTLGRPS